MSSIDYNCSKKTVSFNRERSTFFLMFPTTIKLGYNDHVYNEQMSVVP